MILSVCIPTIGRPECLAKTTAGFETTTPGCEILTVEGMSWGEGCNQLARYAQGDYIYLGCDDTVPHPGWFDHAREMVDAGFTPMSRYFHPDGAPLRAGTDDAPDYSPQPWSRSFLVTPAILKQVGPMLDLSWYVDFDYSSRLAATGRPILACPGFSFTHLKESERTWLTPEEDARQRRVYEAANR